jgi:hypothetical protein
MPAETRDDDAATKRQVRVAWSPAKHRSTLVDVGRTQAGTSEVAIASSGKAAAAASRARGEKYCSSRSTPSAHLKTRQGQLDRPPGALACLRKQPTPPHSSPQQHAVSMYNVDYCGGQAAAAMGVARERQNLQARSEWAQLAALDVLKAQQQV